MRAAASILHVHLDAFFAAVEQRDKPSLRGKPVVVGGRLGSRGVVATASYEARRFGVRSAMPMTEARSRCPYAAFLTGRFDVYRTTSRQVMQLLGLLSPLVEPLSFDEAYVDLAAGAAPDLSIVAVTSLARRLKHDLYRITQGLTGSVGVATSKLVAKVASELDKPDGLVVVPPGGERELLSPMPVSVLPGVGPATADRLRRVGAHTVGDLERLEQAELVRILGSAHGQSLYRLARAEDDRPVVPNRESKSISVEDTFDHDLVDTALLAAIVERHATRVCERLRAGRLSGRTVTVKIRRYDFTTYTRSATLPGPTDRPQVVARVARSLLAEVDTSGGVRLLGVGVSGLADWIQEDLFGADEDPVEAETVPAEDSHWREAGRSAPATTPDCASHRMSSGELGSTPRWLPGMDVVHGVHGPGWVWGSGLGRVTVRFETADTGPGPVRTFPAGDPDLAAAASPA